MSNKLPKEDLVNLPFSLNLGELLCLLQRVFVHAHCHAYLRHVPSAAPKDVPTWDVKKVGRCRLWLIVSLGP